MRKSFGDFDAHNNPWTGRRRMWSESGDVIPRMWDGRDEGRDVKLADNVQDRYSGSSETVGRIMDVEWAVRRRSGPGAQELDTVVESWSSATSPSC